MTLLRPLEQLAEDAKQGDLVRIFLERSDYVGYRWEGGTRLPSSQLIIPKDCDVIFCSLNPYGTTAYGDSQNDPDVVLQKIQFVGINLKTHTLGSEHVRGYCILERTCNTE